jgi:hypothetical protein
MRMPLADWTIVAKYPTVFDAERAKATLEIEGIEAMIQSHGGTGVFGPGYQGPVIGGVSLLVRAADLEKAWVLVVETR